MKEVDLTGSAILIVEDEESLAVGLEYNMTEEGYRVVRADDGRRAVEIFQTQEFDLVVLDIMLPYIDGFEVAEQIRQVSPQIPILMLTARTSQADRIHGLEIGADDYLAKPFHLDELLLRVKGMLRRKQWYRETIGSDAVERFGQTEVNFADLTGRCGQREFRLTPLEAMLLRYLLANPERAVSREELLEHVWQSGPGVETRTVENFIVRLRKHIEPYASRPVHIRTIRGAGYLFSSAGADRP